MESRYGDQAESEASRHDVDLQDHQVDFQDLMRKHAVHKDSLIMFENDQGAHPNLWICFYFVILVATMLFNLYNFHHF